jgi:hypothetical protein
MLFKNFTPKPPKNPLFHFSLQVAGACLCVYLYYWPNSDYFVLGFGALVALMMLYDMEQWQKTIYIFIILILVLFGKRMFDNDLARRDISAQDFKNYVDRYEVDQITDGVTKTLAATENQIVASNEQFKATIAANKSTQDDERRHFDAVLQEETNLFNSQEKELELQASTHEEVDALFEAVVTSAREGSATNSAEIAHAQATRVPTSLPSNPLVPPPLTPAETKELQIKGLQMAKEINEWITSVSKDVPKPTPVPPGEGWNPAAEAADRKADEAYVRTLESEWTAKFGGGPRLLLHQLHNDQGVLLTCTGNAAGGGPTNFLGLCKACADRIEQGSMRLQY